MIAFPNCKINIGLRIIEKRQDGFHNLETVFYPIPLTDILEILPPDKSSENIEFTSTGLQIPGATDNNLCIMAYDLLKKDNPSLGNIRMHLHKVVPMGAGLGGGSADASATLSLLNKLFKLNLTVTELAEYSIQLGSDCPFFILGEPSYATGRGEILEPFKIDLKAYKILLVHPGIHINTAWAFSKITPYKSDNDLRSILGKPVAAWKHELVNDFEEVCMNEYPELQRLKDLLYQNGAKYAAMSGSGSSFFALFDKDYEVNLNSIAYKYNLLSLDTSE